MKITKAKYNWLVAQYNYRKNKEEIIEISDEEYERLTGKSITIIDNPTTDTESIYMSLKLNEHPELLKLLNTGVYAIFEPEYDKFHILHIHVRYNSGEYEDILISSADENEKLIHFNYPIIFGTSNFDGPVAYIGDQRMVFYSNDYILFNDKQYDLNSGICISSNNEQPLSKLFVSIDDSLLMIHI